MYIFIPPIKVNMYVKQVMILLRVSWLKTSHGPLSCHFRINFLSGGCSSYILCFFLISLSSFTFTLQSFTGNHIFVLHVFQLEHVDFTKKNEERCAKSRNDNSILKVGIVPEIYRLLP